ncbi:MAG TPA: hypothetical protein VLX12_04965 [Syntrophorhabdales bacterium]|nr:hypothetical protein [Syntrophorhabdales bacterium]
MVRKIFLTLLFSVLTIPASACAYMGKGNMVDVRIVSDRGGEFTKYRTYPRVHDDGTYFYVEAAKGQTYAVQVVNGSDRRVGVVIAVDGRNIIDGKKSELRRSEQMYILGPYETNTFEGWRTGMDRTNRFYFTEQSDSYAEKVFSDASAMGTIALAVYRERLPEPIHSFEMRSRTNQAPAGAASPAPMESRSYDRAEKKSEQPGTGFGETTYSPVRIVNFEPERAAVEKIVLKYEWRSELCRKGIIACGPKNRFWPDAQEFAPIPRDFRG